MNISTFENDSNFEFKVPWGRYFDETTMKLYKKWQ